MRDKNSNAVCKNLIWSIISVLLAVLTIKLVLNSSKALSVSEIIRLVAASDKAYIIMAAAAGAMYVWFEGVAIRSVLRNIGYPQNPIKGLIYSTADVYFSAVTPSATGGQPASAFFMIRDGIPAEVTAAVLLLNLTMYTVSVIVLGGVSVIIQPSAFMEFGRFSRVLIAVGFVALTVLAFAFFLLLKKGNAITDPLSKLVEFMYDKKIIREKDKKLARIKKAGSDYKRCADMISGRKRILFGAFLWNFLQRASQLTVPMLVYRALGGETARMAGVFAKQCLITIGYNFVPIPGGIGVSDYLMLDGFGSIMSEHLAGSVELISRGITFYICVLISGVITLAGYFVGRNEN